MTKQDKLQKIEEILSTHFVERDDEIHILNIGLISSSHVLFVGPPGTGKTKLVKYWNNLITETDHYFGWLLTKYSTPDELFGPFSLKGLEEDKYIRQTSNKLPEKEIVFIDEIFKANSGILNSLLSVLNERVFFNDGKEIPIPLLMLIGASNEIPEPGEGLDALFDRLTLKCVVSPIKEENNFRTMLTSNNKKIERILSLKEIKEIQSEVQEITITNEVLDTMAMVRRKLIAEGIIITDRTFRMSIDILKAEAYYNKRSEISIEDFDILQHILWSDPDHKKKVYSIILEIINPNKNKMLELINDAEDVYNNIIKTAQQKLPKDDQEAMEIKTSTIKLGLETIQKLKEIKVKLENLHKVALDQKREKELKDIKKYDNQLNRMLDHIYKTTLGLQGMNP